MPIVQRTDAARTALFIHGTPGDRRVWSEVVRRAPPGWGVAVLELLDHGVQSVEPDARLEPFEAEVTAAIAEIGGPVRLVGHSLGAWLAARAMARGGVAIDRAVLISGFASLPVEAVEMRRGLLAQLRSGAVTARALVPALIDLWLGTAATPAATALCSSLVLDQDFDRVLRSVERILVLDQPAWSVPRYTTRATVVHADGDRAVPCAAGEALAALGASVQWLALRSDSHLLPVTHPDDVARVVFED